MKKTIVGIAAISVIAMLAIAIFLVGGFNPDPEPDPWPTPIPDPEPDPEFNDAYWGQEIDIVYEDGTRQSLNSIFGNMALEMMHDGKEVLGIWYRLSGKASGTADQAEVDIGNFQYTLKLEQNGNTKYTRTFIFSEFYDWVPTTYWDPVVPIDVDGDWHYIFDSYRKVSEMGSGSVDDGSYSFSVIPQGSLRYRVSGSDTWTDGGSLPAVTFDVSVSGDWVSIEFESGIRWHP